jgi:thymidylate kinase
VNPLEHHAGCRRRLIVLSGVDGSGKSTQIQLLRTRLEQHGQRVKVVWARGGYTPGMNALKTALRRLTGARVIPHSGPGAARTAAFSRGRTRRWWLRLAILDLIVLYALTLRCRLATGCTVICDRYWPDTLLDFRLNFPQEDISRWWLWKLLTKLAVVPHAAFLLLVPVEESLRRSQQKNEPFPDPPQVLAQRLSAYRQMADAPEWTVIDGCQPKQDIAEAIYAKVCDGRPLEAMVFNRS